MSGLKFTYFDFAGSRGEEVRLALTIANVAFEDNRLSVPEFGEFKPHLPFGSLPVLEVINHGTISQTNAILRLIGRLYGLHPEEPFEAARHDELMDAVEDLRHKIAPTMRMEDAVEKKAARQKLTADYIPQWGAGVERLIRNGPFVAGEKLCVADIKLFMADRWISSGGVDDIPETSFDSFAKFKAIADGVKNHPAVGKWYDTES